jgi:hypothetical protein
LVVNKLAVNYPWYKHPVIISATIINAFILLLALAWSGNPHELSRLLVEDGIVEWMQFLAFSLTSGLLGYVAVDRWKNGGMRLEVLVLLGLTGLVAVAALEEISWFQRILQIQSPEFFLQNNRQAETNLHNLGFGEESLHKAVLLKVILISGLIHNLFLPLLARKRPAVRTFVERFGLYLPPLAASIPYLVLVILSHLLIDHPRKGELGETFGAVHYLATVFGAYFVGVAYDKKPLFAGLDARRVSVLFTLLMFYLLMTGWMLSAGAGAIVTAVGAD